MLGYPKRCNHLWDYGGDVKIMGYPIIYPAGLEDQCNKKCDRGWVGKAGIGISQNVSPP